MSEKFITLTSFTYHAEAYVLVARLESEGVTCKIGNDHTLAANPLLSNAVGGIEVKVPVHEYDHALRIFREFQSGNQDKEKLPSPDLENFVRFSGFCPDCESSNVYRKKRPFFSMFSPSFNICADCLNTWRS